MRKPGLRVVAAVLVAVALGVAGCRSGDEPAADPEPRTTLEERSAPDAAEGSQRDRDEEAGDEDAGEEDERGPAGDSIEVDLQQTSPYGVVLQVLEVSAGNTSTSIEIEVINGSKDEVTLNGISLASSDGIRLADDLGNFYAFAEPEQNAMLTVAPGQVLSGTLTFLGRVHDDARSLRLLVNTDGPLDDLDAPGELHQRQVPAFDVDDIPVPGR